MEVIGKGAVKMRHVIESDLICDVRDIHRCGFQEPSSRFHPEMCQKFDERRSIHPSEGIAKRRFVHSNRIGRVGQGDRVHVVLRNQFVYGVEFQAWTCQLGVNYFRRSDE